MNNESNEDENNPKNIESNEIYKNDIKLNENEEIEVDKKIKVYKIHNIIHQRNIAIYQSYPKRRRRELSSSSNSSSSESENENEDENGDKSEEEIYDELKKEKNDINFIKVINESSTSLALSIREKLKYKNGYKPKNIKFNDNSKEINPNLYLKNKEMLDKIPKIINRVISDGISKEIALKSEKEQQLRLLSRQIGKNSKFKHNKN